MQKSFEKIVELLDANRIKYEVIEHDPVYTSEQAAKIRGMDLSQGAKSLLLKTNQEFLLAVLPGDRRVDTKKLKTLLSIKDIRFATPQEVVEIMGCEIGACYPLGNIIPLKMIIDQSLSQNEIISFNPGMHNKTIKMSWKDYFALTKPELADFSSEKA